MLRYSFIIYYLFLYYWMLFPLGCCTATTPSSLKPLKTYQRRAIQGTTHALQVLNNDILVTIKIALYSVTKRVAVFCNYMQMKGVLAISYVNSILDTLTNRGAEHRMHITKSNEGCHDSEIVDGHHESEIVHGHHESEIVHESVEKEKSVDDTAWTSDDVGQGPLLLLEQYDKGGEEHLFELFCKYSKLLLVFLLSAGIIAITYFFAMMNLNFHVLLL